MSRYPSYNSPLQLPDIQVGQPIRYPAMPTKSSSSGKKSSKTSEPELEGTVGDVNSYYRNLNAIQNEMNNIMTEYGIGNMAYAEKYDKRYIGLKNQLNAYTSPAMFNEIKRRLQITEDYKNLFKTKAGESGTGFQGTEIDLGVFESTGGKQIQTFNTTLAQMEYGGLDFDMSSVDMSPDVTSFEDAKEMIRKQFSEVTGNVSSKELTQTLLSETNQYIGDKKVVSKVTAGGNKYSDNINALNSAAGDIASNVHNLGSIKAGLTRGFLMTNEFYEIQKNYKGENLIGSKEYQEAFGKFVLKNIQDSRDQFRKIESDKGVYEQGADYVDVGDEAMNRKVAGTSLIAGLKGPLERQDLVVGGVKVLDDNGNAITNKESIAPKGANGFMQTRDVVVANAFTAKQLVKGFMPKDFMPGSDGTINLADMAAGTYAFMKSGNYFSKKDMAGWFATDFGTNVMAGNIAGRINVNFSDKTFDIEIDGKTETFKIPASVYNGNDGINFNANTEQEREFYNKLAEHYKDDPVIATALSQYGVSVGTEMQRSKKSFFQWGQETMVPVAANYTPSVSEISFADIPQKWLINNINSQTVGGAGTQMRETKIYYHGNKLVSTDDIISMYAKDTNWHSGGNKNKLKDVAHVKEAPLIVTSNTDGYTNLRDENGSSTGYYIANGYENEYTFTRDKDGNGVVKANVQIGIDTYLLNTDEGQEVFLNSYDAWKQKQVTKSNLQDQAFNIYEPQSN